jgi:hypothetical protein
MQGYWNCSWASLGFANVYQPVDHAVGQPDCRAGYLLCTTTLRSFGGESTFVAPPTVGRRHERAQFFAFALRHFGCLPVLLIGILLFELALDKLFSCFRDLVMNSGALRKLNLK